MSVEFVYGRPGREMDRLLNETAAAGVADDPTAPVFVVTPRQSTYGTEIQIQNALSVPGHMGLEVVSMEEIARDILDSVYGGAQEFVNMAGKSMLIRGILDRRREELSAFRWIAAAPDLPAAIAKQIARLQQAGISAEELQNYADANPNMLRIRDLALLYGELETLMKGRVDSEGALNLAIDHMPDAWFLKDALVIVRGFDEWSAQQIRFVEALIRQADRVVVELPSVADGQPDHALYRSSETARDRLTGAAVRHREFTGITVTDGEPSDIVRVAASLFSRQAFRPLSGDAMEITSHPDAEAEVRFLAAEIVRLHEEEGVAFGDMAIVWGETQEYEPLIRRVFADARIPYFTGERKTLADSNIAEFVLTACELLSGPLRRDAVLAHAATGFTDLSTVQLGQLINYARMMVSWGRELERPFATDKALDRGFRDNAKDAEQAREQLMSPILADLRPEGREGDIFTALERYVTRQLSEERIEAMAAEMNTEYEQASFMMQSLEAIVDLIRQAGQLLSPDMEGGELRRVLRAGLEAVELSLVPAALDEVQAGPVRRTYVPPVEHVFFVGVNDEVLPRFGDAGGDLLTTEEWNHLVADLKNFEPQSDAEAQKYRIVRTMMQAARRVHWSYNNGGETKPSVIIAYLKRLYHALGAGENGETPPEEVAARMLRLKQNAYEAVVGEIRNAADGSQAQIDAELAAAVLFDPEFSLRTSQLRDSLTKPNAAVKAPPRHAPRSLSASRLQTYGACPYQHFVQYQLGAWSPPDVIIGKQNAGSFMHGTLDGLARALPGRWSDVGEDEFLRLFRENLEVQRTAQIGPDPHPRNRARLDVIEPRLLEAALALRSQQELGRLQPLITELPFDVELGGGLVLKGIIDRLDAGQLGGSRFLSLVDYKSREHPFSLRNLLLGTDVQLMVYLLALSELLAGRAGAGGDLLLPSDRIAGAGFLNLLPGMDSKEPADLLALYRMNGILAVGPEAAGELYGLSGSSLGSFRQRVKDGGVYHGQDAWRAFLPAEDGTNRELNTFMDGGRELITIAAKGCAAGDNRISPARPRALACQWCQYRSICRFEPREQPQAVRRPEAGTESSLRDRLLGVATDRSEEAEA